MGLLKNNVKQIGIPLEQASDRLVKLNKAIEKLNMAVGAEVGYHLNVYVKNEDKKQIVTSATIEVYFLGD